MNEATDRIIEGLKEIQHQPLEAPKKVSSLLIVGRALNALGILVLLIGVVSSAEMLWEFAVESNSASSARRAMQYPEQHVGRGDYRSSNARPQPEFSLYMFAPALSGSVTCGVLMWLGAAGKVLLAIEQNTRTRS